MDGLEMKSEAFTWIGKSSADYTSKRRAKLHYDSFRKGSLTVSVADHVLIRNDDSREPENIEFCFIGKVLDLYEKVDEDPYCCEVQWYVRLTEIPPQLQNEIHDGDYHQEVIEDSRNLWRTAIDAETIFGKCHVFKFSNYISSTVLPDYLDSKPVFYCRYNYDGRKLRDVSPMKSPKVQIPHFRQPIINQSQETINRTKSSRQIKHNCPKSSRETEAPHCSSTERSKVDKKNRKNLTQPCKIEADKHERKPASLALQEEDIMGLMNTPSKPVLQPTPVKSFYSSEKKQVQANLTDATRVRRALPFDLPKKDGDKRVIESKKSNEEKVLSEKGFDSKRKQARTQKSSDIVRRKNRSFLLNKENEITPYEMTRITRSGRKVQLPNYLDYWDEFSVSADESKSGKRSNDSLSESTDEDERDVSRSVKKSKKSSKERREVSTILKKARKMPTSLLRPRKTKHEAPKTPLEEARAYLHVSAVPDSLPCRENEFSDIFTFVEGKLIEKRGGCMYISGVPGTGKTATVHEVIRTLKENCDLGHIPSFNFVEINALRLTNPQQCYVHLLKALKGVDATQKHAADLLSSYFEEGKKNHMTVVMLDELDMLWTKRQDVLYNMFQWPTLPHSHLIVLAIANTMDLPERLLANKIVSRLGLTRMTFQPYTYKQLEEIVMSRIERLGAFNPDAVQLVARKVASVSGDARRALDICRRATELVNSETRGSKKGTAEYLVGMKQVNEAVQEMFCLAKISAIRNVSVQEQQFLRGIVADFLSTGLEETTFQSAAKHYADLCRVEGVPVLNTSKLLSICSQLYDTRLLLLENGKADVYQRIKLNISIDDINYALKDK